MNKDNLCSEAEAISVSGVSSRTLLRFSEAGYLTVFTEPDGSRRYDRTQVEEIFGLSQRSSPAPEARQFEPSSDLISVCNSGAQTEPSATEIQVPQPDPTPSHPESAARSIANEPVMPPPSSKQSSELEQETARLHHLLEMQERILDSKDDEIADLRSQRAWLRERIEKLEEKAERDQILLLSETQTIRSLIAYQESKKSTFRQLLEWAGVVRENPSGSLPQPGEYHPKNSPQHSASRTIEVARAANAD